MKDLYKSIEGFLPPVFNLDPEKERAFFISSQYDAPKVFIENGVLKVFTRGRYYPDVSVALRGKTIQAVMDAVAAVSGFSVEGINYADKSAQRLIKPDYDEDSGYVYVFTNPAVAFFKAFALELEDARDAMEAVIRWMTVFGATGTAQEFWGDYFDVARLPGEEDDLYGHRIALEIKQPKTNNKSIEKVIKEVLGIETQVVDLGWTNPSGLLFLNDEATFVNDLDFALWNTSDYVAENSTLGVILTHGLTIGDLSAGELAQMLAIVTAIKQAGIRSKLLWKAVDCTGYETHAGGMCGLYF